ncbi:hypothetical protein HPP92_029176 [Vanilla planifolia]|uniref:Uncharacterized protein n=1 Tax=Vanilla planifolia TaxID=51239 RepID=A0A835P6F8_VANPL|nr:hypothetical protein HPP92_029176 [Vanilla planifolia]KAG0445773.1 hypothetical protein HPP92_029163 [Vanilla planifolia]
MAGMWGLLSDHFGQDISFGGGSASWGWLIREAEVVGQWAGWGCVAMETLE